MPETDRRRRRAADAADAAARTCAAEGMRLTELRRRVLEIVLESDRPVGAYDILAALSRERGKVAPPTIYRALDFLLARHLIHRVHSLNAFVACAGADEGHTAELFICRTCGATEERIDDSLRERVRSHADDLGFVPESIVLEVQGLCRGCKPGAP